MSWNWKHVFARAAALASVGLVAATLAWAQTGSSGPASGSTAPPSTGGSPTGGTRSPSTGSPIGGSNIDTAEGETPDATRPGVSASQPPRLGSSGTVPGIGTRSRTRSYDDSDTDATFDAESTTRSARQFEDDADEFRDAARETRSDARQSARDTRSEARETSDDFRDAARETSRDARSFSRDTAEDARERADEFRDTTRDAREFSRDTRRDARDTAEDFRDAARETDRFEDRQFRDSDRFSDREFDRDSDRFTDRPSRDEDRFPDRQFDRDQRRFTERDARLDREEDRFSSDRSTTTREDRFRSDSRVRTSSDFRVDNLRPADIGLWFDSRSSDGLVINDLGTGVISRWGFREGDRIYSVNGVRVDSERAFLTSLFDPRWRDQRASVIIYRHGRPWTVYMYPSQLVTEYTTVATVDPLEQYGLILDDRYDDYVVVWRVLPRTPAFYAGLRPGDVITTFDNRRLTGREDFVRWMSRGNLDSVALGINRNRQSRLVDLDLSQAGTFSSSTGVSGTRTSLRPDLDAAGRFDGTLDGRLDGVGGAQFDSRTDTRFDTRSGAQLDGRTDAQFDSRVRTPTGTIPNRLRGSADAAIDADAGAIQPGTIRGTTSDGIQGTVQPRGVLPRVGGAIQGGVRGGGLFRGNR